MSLFERSGSEPNLRAMVQSFYDAVFDDLMIGFFFARADKTRLIDKEYELIAELLGGPVQYTGRALDRAHRPHPIRGGHFERRLKLLSEAMERFSLPEEARARVLEHNRAHRAEITDFKGSGCEEP